MNVALICRVFGTTTYAVIDSVDHEWQGVYASKASALRAAWAKGYTHAYGSGVFWDVTKVRVIPTKYHDFLIFSA